MTSRWFDRKEKGAISPSTLVVSEHDEGSWW